MWNAFLWFFAGWWVGNRMGLGQPLIPANVQNAPNLTTAATNAEADATAQVQAAASGSSGGSGDGNTSPPPLVASGQTPSAGAPPSIQNTGMTVNGMPVCIDSFNNLVDCTTGQPLDNASAQVIINALQQTRSSTGGGSAATVQPAGSQLQPTNGYRSYGRRYGRVW